jgi:hypothetical protein
MKLLSLVVLCVLTSLSAANAQDRAVKKSPSIHAAKSSGESMRVDGVLDEPEWRSAEAGNGFTQREPQDGSPATEQTEVKVVYTSDALYVGVRSADSRAAEIKAELARRDRGSQSTKWHLS